MLALELTGVNSNAAMNINKSKITLSKEEKVNTYENLTNIKLQR